MAFVTKSDVSSQRTYEKFVPGGDEGMKQYKLQELVGTTKRLPRSESLFYETLISFRKLPECAQLFLPLKLQNHLKVRKTSSRKGSQSSNKSHESLRRQCSTTRDDEEVQSYSEWKYFMSWIKLSSLKQFRRLRKSVIYLLPIGPFPVDMLASLVSPQLGFLHSLVSFGEAFFPGMSFKLLPEVDYEATGCQTRIHQKTGQLQLLLPDVMQYLSKVAPKDSIGILGLSWIDLYPGDEWNNILGEGSVQSGCAAVSFGHYSMFMPQESVSSISSQVVEEVVSNMRNIPEDIELKKEGRINKERKKQAYISKSFKPNHFPASLIATASRRTTSCIDISVERDSSVVSDLEFDVTMNQSPLTNSFHSLKALGSLPSINNSWTQLFGLGDSGGSCSNLSISDVDENSYDIIKQEEAGNMFKNHATEEDVIKLAIPVGSTFHMSCLTMWRLFKCITHEVCHIFGLSHCNFYECAMNSSRLISEVDEQPIFLCPICLRKLQKFLKFRLCERYRKMREVLNGMSPCFLEETSVHRGGFDVNNTRNTGHSTPKQHRRNISQGFAAGETEQGYEDPPSRHICIKVTKEKNDDFDVINVEYKDSSNHSDRHDYPHDCHFFQALNKLDNIVEFLKRH
eukprot:gene18269-20089_t